MIEDMNFANHMYTKISDLKLNNDEKLKYNEDNLNRMSEDNNYRKDEDKFNNYIKEQDKFNRYKLEDNNYEKEDIKFNNYKENSISDLDYLNYEENNKKTKKRKKTKKNNDQEQDNNSKIRLYILLFIIFCFLNSYLVINLINSYRIQYKLSLVIRASMFLILYYLVNRFV